MDAQSSGEDLVIKARKPYTITKQRQRWTEDEHNKFIEALKLYGRAWQRIEEHIGTKTAVQIRSHAQKFFSKLEKEALVNGVRTGQSIGLHIPPPRPKRKPTNPYPRKSSSATPTRATSGVGAKDGKLLSSASSSYRRLAVDLEKELLHKRPTREEKREHADNPDGCYSEVFTLLHQGHCSSASSANNNSIPSQVALRNACTSREFVPSVEKVTTQHATNESHFIANLRGHQNLKKVDAEKIDEDNGTSGASKSENTDNASHKEWVQAIAAATVTAATAWWASHGMFPLQTAFGCPLLSITRAPVPSMDTGQAPPTKIVRGENSLKISSLHDQQLDPKHSEAIKAQHSNNAKPNTDAEKGVASTEEVHDTNHAKCRKQVDLSSYGSNTPSVREVETDALKKHDKGKEQLKDHDVYHPAAESSHRRNRNVSNMNDSWKVVSEEGRMAFQALLSKEVLPQSFSLPHYLNNKGHQKDTTEEGKQMF